MTAELMVKCVNAHDRCDGGPCPYCEPVIPPRTEDGRFAPIPGTYTGPDGAVIKVEAV